MRTLIVEKSPWLENTVTGEKYQMVYSASGKAPSAKPAKPIEPGYVTRQFAANQGELQLRYVGRSVTLPSVIGDAPEASYLGTSRPYYINNGKIVTALVGTPIEITLYKVGDKYSRGRSDASLDARCAVMARPTIRGGDGYAARHRFPPG